MNKYITRILSVMEVASAEVVVGSGWWSTSFKSTPKIVFVSYYDIQNAGNKHKNNSITST